MRKVADVAEILRLASYRLSHLDAIMNSPSMVAMTASSYCPIVFSDLRFAQIREDWDKRHQSMKGRWLLGSFKVSTCVLTLLYHPDGQRQGGVS